MPRIIYSNPLSTAGEGIRSGLDVIKEQEQHESNLKLNEKRMQAFDAELQDSLAGLEQRRAQRVSQEQDLAGLKAAGKAMPFMDPESGDILEGMGTAQGVQTFLQLKQADAELRRREENRIAFEGERQNALTDPEYPVDQAMLDAALAGVDPQDFEGQRVALRAARSETRHRMTQVAQRSFARGEVQGLAAQFPESFRPPIPGMPATFQQGRIEELLDELDDDPNQIKDGPRDYLGALAELRIYADPALQGGARRLLETVRRDYEDAQAALQQGGAYGAPRPGGGQMGPPEHPPQDPDVMGGGAQTPAPITPATEGAQPTLDSDVVAPAGSAAIVKAGVGEEAAAQGEAFKAEWSKLYPGIEFDENNEEHVAFADQFAAEGRVAAVSEKRKQAHEAALTEARKPGDERAATEKFTKNRKVKGALAKLDPSKDDNQLVNELMRAVPFSDPVLETPMFSTRDEAIAVISAWREDAKPNKARDTTKAFDAHFKKVMPGEKFDPSNPGHQRILSEFMGKGK